MASCGGSGASDGSHPTTTRAKSTTTTSLPVTSTTLAPTSAAVLSAYRAGWAAFEHALTTANPSDPELAATMVDPQLQSVKANLFADKRAGMVARGTIHVASEDHGLVGHDGNCGRLRLQHGRAHLRDHWQAGAAGYAPGERRGARHLGVVGLDVEGVQADSDGGDMRARFVIPAAVVVASVCVLIGPSRAWAGDPDGQYGWGGATANGGQLTVQAGGTYWTPPAGSSWAKQTESDPSPGKPDPNQPYDCTYQALGPSGTQLLGAGGPTPGQWVIPTCAGPGTINPMPPIWVTNAQPVAGAGQVDPVVVADQTIQQLPLGSATIKMAPPAGSEQLVGVATWLWIEPGAWQTLTATASAGTVTTTATATPTKVVWNMGDGSTVTCDGPGTPYDPNDPNATTDCSYTWTQAGSYQVTATIYWSVSWTAVGAPGGGNLGLKPGPPSQMAVRVTESQAINTPISGGN